MRLAQKRKRVVKSPEVRREDLLDAAVQVFSREGISAATVSDITQAAGVAKGTFYLYFDSKEHVLAALRERFVDEIMEHAAGLMERVGKDDWWGLADATIESWIDFDLDHRDLLHLFTREGITPATQDTFAECERKMTEMMAAGIEAGCRAGAFRVVDPKLTASFLHHAIEGAVLESILRGEELDRDHLIDASKELVRKALAP